MFACSGLGTILEEVPPHFNGAVLRVSIFLNGKIRRNSRHLDAIFALPETDFSMKQINMEGQGLFQELKDRLRPLSNIEAVAMYLDACVDGQVVYETGVWNEEFSLTDTNRRNIVKIMMFTSRCVYRRMEIGRLNYKKGESVLRYFPYKGKKGNIEEQLGKFSKNDNSLFSVMSYASINDNKASMLLANLLMPHSACYNFVAVSGTILENNNKGLIFEAEEGLDEPGIYVYDIYKLSKKT